MKTLEELQTIRKKMANQLSLRHENQEHTLVVVGMATCGIASGARQVLITLANLVQEKGLAGKILVTQKGCMGLCRYEPIVEVSEPGKAKVTYIRMTPEKAAEIVDHHFLGGHVVEEYTLAMADIR